MDQVRANMNSNRDEILQNTFTRGLPRMSILTLRVRASLFFQAQALPPSAESDVGDR